MLITPKKRQYSHSVPVIEIPKNFQQQAPSNFYTEDLGNYTLAVAQFIGQKLSVGV